MDKNKHYQPLYVKLMISIAMIVILLCLLEIGLRVADISIYEQNNFFPKNRNVEFSESEVYKKDHTLFWRFRTSQNIDSKSFDHIVYHINSDGMRGKELPKIKKGLRILALGNSCTFGWGVQEELIWESLLQNRLQSTFPEKKIEIINAGVPGYSSFQGMHYFKNELVEKVEPDILLIMFGWNDQWTAGISISDANQKMPSQMILDIQNFFSKMKFYQLYKKIILTLTDKNEFQINDNLNGIKRVSVTEIKSNLQSIIRTAKKNSIIPIIMVPPAPSVENYFSGQKSKFHHIHSLYQQQIINTAKYERISCINHQQGFDLYNDLFDDVYVDPIHFNVKGQKIFSEQIESLLIPLIDSLH